MESGTIENPDDNKLKIRPLPFGLRIGASDRDHPNCPICGPKERTDSIWQPLDALMSKHLQAGSLFRLVFHEPRSSVSIDFIFSYVKFGAQNCAIIKPIVETGSWHEFNLTQLSLLNRSQCAERSHVLGIYPGQHVLFYYGGEEGEAQPCYVPLPVAHILKLDLSTV